MKAGIIINDISDHKMIFTFLEIDSYVEKVDRYIEIEKKDEKSLQSFINELKSLNIYDQFDSNNNPEKNYNIFSSLLRTAREKHLPKKRVKYNKKKHKKNKWMTNGILESINNKDILYKLLIQTDPQNEPLFNNLKFEYKAYRASLRRSIREAKRLYYMNKFNAFKNDIKKTWTLINDTLNKHVRNETHHEFLVNNKVIKDAETIANSLNDYCIYICCSIAEKFGQLMNSLSI